MNTPIVTHPDTRIRGRRVVLVGGAGDVGSMIRPALSSSYQVVVADRNVQGGSASAVPFDVLDPEPHRDVFGPGDVLVYLAMGSKADWGSLSWSRSQFDINVTGLYLTLRAAAGRGVRKVVVASSMSVFANYLDPLGLADEPDAHDGYGLSKRLGEQVARAAVVAHELDVIALRLVAPVPDEEWHRGDPPYADVMTAGSDVAGAVRAAIESPLQGFHAFTISGDHDRRRLDISAARVLLGWTPALRRPSP